MAASLRDRWSAAATSPEARAMSPGDPYRKLRRWYARDRGRTTLLAVVELLERTAAPGSSARRGAA